MKSISGFRKQAKGYKQRKRGQQSFVHLFNWMMATEAWATMSPGPRALYVELKKRYNGHNNGAIFLSHRDAAMACNVHRNTVGNWFRLLEERGFIEMTKGPHLGPSGVGIAATWTLTEYPTTDMKRATNAFKKWRTPA
jgi:hypothetical protein